VTCAFPELNISPSIFLLLPLSVNWKKNRNQLFETIPSFFFYSSGCNDIFLPVMFDNQND
jgi:hypothetical protein